MSKRLYLGRLPPDARSEDVSKLFEGYGRIIDCRVMTGFGFVEFESSKDAEDAVHNFNGKPFMGVNSIVVEFAKESRPRRDRDPYEGGDRRDGPPRSRRPPGIRLIVSGISRDTSWQDLKDFGREAGSVSFADIDRDRPGNGILEYLSRDDADRAIKDLDGRDLRGRPVQVALDDARPGPDNYRRDRSRSPYRRSERGSDRPSGYDYDRYERARHRSPQPDYYRSEREGGRREGGGDRDRYPPRSDDRYPPRSEDRYARDGDRDRDRGDRERGGGREERDSGSRRERY